MTTVLTNAQRMTNLADLRNQAINACVARGHQMTNFVEANERGNMFRAECQKCNCFVDINVNPLPNENEISGDALALECVKP